ncbi:20726_t:CDS:2 [Funneliformis geosporum]|uniref:11641_t:CDS:1 n=1 Tax=Funneliformis geosporum TaxID=1117311 RepID=A0A9W4SF09_9GLOM|nr:20726_t:CDS:2 [Funneliformis geosporum]CAI2167172.1 11641_t:CDS:2 [Funneliformis geosporum]
MIFDEELQQLLQYSDFQPRFLEDIKGLKNGNVNSEINNSDIEVNQRYCQSPQCRFLFVYSNSGSSNIDFLSTFAYLSIKLNRTLVLTNVGQSRLDSCKKFPFEFYYNIEYLRKKFHRLSFTSQVHFQNWTRERFKEPNFHYLHFTSSSSSSSFDQDEDDEHIENIKLNDRSVKRTNCLENFKMKFNSNFTSFEKIIFKSRLSLNSFGGKKLSKSLIKNLEGSNSEILLINYDIKRETFHPVSVKYLYSQHIYQEAWEIKMALKPFIAIYWNMIGITDATILSNCAEKLINALKGLRENYNLNNIYLSTDYPISSDFTSFRHITKDHRRAINLLSSTVNINTWSSFDAFNEIRQEKGNHEEFKGTGIVSILDKLVCIESDYFITAPSECSSKSTNDFIKEIISTRQVLDDDDNQRIQNIISRW